MPNKNQPIILTNKKQTEMKKNFLVVVTMLTLATTIQAQKLKKYDKLFYVNTKQETSDVTVFIETAVANDKMLKFKIKIVNKTNDYIIYKTAETKLVVNGKEYKPSGKEKEMIISPLDNDSKVINIMGDGFNAARSCNYVIDGLYKISSKGNGVATADYKLPGAKADFSTGGFNCNMTSLYKQTDATKLDFKVSYTGEKTGCIFPANATLLMPDGNEYPAKKPGGLFAKPGLIILNKGTTDEFNVTWDQIQGGKAMDMQKVPLTIKWNETFCELTPINIKSLSMDLEIDETLSK